MADALKKILPRQQHWRRTRRLTAILLGTWLGLTLAVVFFARPLAHLTLFGWPVPFYLAAQGVVLAYLAIVAVYVWRMHRLDQACATENDGGDHAA